MANRIASNLHLVHVEQPEYRSILKSQAQPVSFPLNQEDCDLIEGMKKKLYELEGVGLAAPQVNHSKQILAIYIPEEAASLREGVYPCPMHVMINPSYEAISGTAIVYDYEACYSVPDRAAKVPRFNEIQISYYDESGQFHEQRESGYYARVIQHEVDHLNGILFIDRLSPDDIQGTMQEIMALRRAELEEEKRILLDNVLERKRRAQQKS